MKQVKKSNTKTYNVILYIDYKSGIRRKYKYFIQTGEELIKKFKRRHKLSTIEDAFIYSTDAIGGKNSPYMMFNRFVENEIGK